MYGSDNGDGLFPLPDTRNRVTRHLGDDTGGLGFHQEDALQSFTGKIHFDATRTGNEMSPLTGVNSVLRDGIFNTYQSAKPAAGSNIERTTDTSSRDIATITEVDLESGGVKTAGETRVKSLIVEKAIWYE